MALSKETVLENAEEYFINAQCFKRLDNPMKVYTNLSSAGSLYLLLIRSKEVLNTVEKDKCVKLCNDISQELFGIETMIRSWQDRSEESSVEDSSDEDLDNKFTKLIETLSNCFSGKSDTKTKFEFIAQTIEQPVSLCGHESLMKRVVGSIKMQNSQPNWCPNYDDFFTRSMFFYGVPGSYDIVFPYYGAGLCDTYLQH